MLIKWLIWQYLTYRVTGNSLSSEAPPSLVGCLVRMFIVFNWDKSEHKILSLSGKVPAVRRCQDVQSTRWVVRRKTGVFDAPWNCGKVLMLVRTWKGEHDVLIVLHLFETIRSRIFLQYDQRGRNEWIEILRSETFPRLQTSCGTRRWTCCIHAYRCTELPGTLQWVPFFAFLTGCLNRVSTAGNCSPYTVIC